jgi:hypothetical protein
MVPNKRPTHKFKLTPIDGSNGNTSMSGTRNKIVKGTASAKPNTAKVVSKQPLPA